MRARMVIFGLGRNSIIALEYLRFELHSILLDLDDRFPEVPKKAANARETANETVEECWNECDHDIAQR